MFRMSIPEINNIILWDTIVSKKTYAKRDRLLAVRQQVLDRYSVYQEYFNSSDGLLPLGETAWKDVKKELISCYGNNIAFQQAKKTIFEDKVRCPYCMLNRPNTLDHYFDKSDYPEYAVFVPNLIPCCSECNTQKGTAVYDNEGHREYLHFYLDCIPAYQFLFVHFEVEAETSVPQITTFLRFRDNEPACREIESHFQNLRLNDKYKMTISDRLSTILNEFQISKEEGLTLNDLKASISIRHRSCVKGYGYNYWEACMYEGILNSPNFMESYWE